MSADPEPQQSPSSVIYTRQTGWQTDLSLEQVAHWVEGNEGVAEFTTTAYDGMRFRACVRVDEIIYAEEMTAERWRASQLAAMRRREIEEGQLRMAESVQTVSAKMPPAEAYGYDDDE